MNSLVPMSVSVVIPLFNRADRIEGAVRSVLEQEPRPLEIIVVDDGSSDKPDLARVSEIDARVRVICHERNRGGSVARNTGIDAASGDFIAFLDADDRWLPNKLAVQLSQIRDLKTKNYFACANVRLDGGAWDGAPINQRPPHAGEDISRYLLVHCCTFQTSALLLPAELAKSVRFDERLKRYQDFDFVLRLLKGGARYIYCHEPLAAWWSEEDPTRVSRQKSVEPTLFWLRAARSLMTSDAAVALYFRDAFRRHVKGEPLSALSLALKLGLKDRQSMSWILKRIPRLVRSQRAPFAAPTRTPTEPRDA